MAKLRLSLIRHAKAEAAHRGSGGDYERPLSARGEQNALAMADHLRGLDFAPDRIFSSSARPAMQPSECLAAGLGQEPSAIISADELYLADPAELLRLVRGCDMGSQHLAVVGHNPGLAGFWGWLTGVAIPNLPTCGVVLLDVAVENWVEVDAAAAELIELLLPANIGPRDP